jgi:hypothetical protein
MANDYTTSTDAFADISEGNYASTDYPVMASFVTTASRLIDREVGRWDGFFASSATTDAETDMYYDGSGRLVQPIDEFVSISAVAVSEQGSLTSTDYTSWTLNTDYLTLPYNSAAKGKPINALALVDYNGTKGAWYAYQKNVKVTGIPGYATTAPDIVAQACKMQAVRWFMRAKQGYQDTGAQAEIGGLTFSKKLDLDPDVKQLIYGLKLELDR